MATLRTDGGEGVKRRVFAFDPENPRREGVLAFMADVIRQCGRRVVITVAEPTRSLEANAAMWAMLADLARQVEWPVDGKLQRLSPEDWKHILTAGLKREQRVAQGVAGGFVMLGQRTSRMTQREMGELLDLIAAFGAEHNVRFTEPARAA